MPTKKKSSLGLITLLSMIMEGSERAVTAIMKERTVPRPTPLAKRASAMGMVPKMSAYIGIPRAVANRTEKGLLFPRTAWIRVVGIQLWITAPMATPPTTYQKTFLTVPRTCCQA